jgi:hypothetical protein
MNAPAVVGAGMRLWARHWLSWGLITLLFSGVVSVALAAADPQPALTTPEAWADRTAEIEPGATALVLLLSAAAAVLLGPWLYVILARGSLLATIEGARQGGIDRTIRGVRSVLWILVLLLLAAIAALLPFGVALGIAAARTSSDDTTGVAVVLGFVLLLAVLLWILPRLAVLMHVYAGEDLRGRKAIGEAWRRTQGAWWTSLGVVVLNILIAFGISLIPSSIANSAFPLATVGHAVPRAVLLALTNALVAPIGFAVTAALYLELSSRKGTLSQAALRRHLARFDPP